MTTQVCNTIEKALLAIDVAKSSSEALLELPSGKRKQINFRHTSEGIASLISTLKSLRVPVRVAFEPTGDYHRTLAERFLVEGLEVEQVSSIAVARYREMIFDTWDKNDRKDTAVILHLMKLGIVQKYHHPSGTAQGLIELSNIYRHVTLLRTRVQHQFITHFLPLYFPELERYWYSTRALWMITMLRRFPTPAHIRAISKESFVAECHNLVRRVASLKPGKFEELYDVAGSSIGLPANDLAVEAFREHLSHLEDLERRRESLERRAKQIIEDIPDAKILQSLPGIGTIHALTILAEAGDLRRFRHHRQFLNYCGFNLSKVQSGTFKGKEQLSKRGNPILRKTFWMAATVAIRLTENTFREKFRRYTQAMPENKDLRRKARTAVAAKMARIAHALVVSGQTYKPYHEYNFPSDMTSLNSVRGGALATS